MPLLRPKKKGDNCVYNNIDSVQIATDFGEGPIITSINPPEGGNNGVVTVQLFGLRFMEGIQVWLISPTGEQITAHFVDFKFSGILFASFNLDGADLGMYDVHIQNIDGQGFEFISGFKVVPGPFGWKGEANAECLANDFDPGQLLDFRMEHLQQARRNRPFRVEIYFKNNSNIDIPVITKIFRTETNEIVSLTRCDLPYFVRYKDEDGPCPPGEGPPCYKTRHHCSYLYGSIIPIYNGREQVIEFKELNGPDNILRAGVGGKIIVWVLPVTGNPSLKFFLED